MEKPLYQQIATALDARDRCRERQTAQGGDPNAKFWFERWEDCLCDIEKKFLPRGSGFNAGCSIFRDDVAEGRSFNSGFAVHTSYLAADDDEISTYFDFEIIVEPDLIHDFTLSIKCRTETPSRVLEYVTDVFNETFRRNYSF